MPHSPFKEDDGRVEKVVAAGLSINIGLADDRQMTFQSGFEGDEPDDVVNARIDRMMRFADRQKARYEIPKLEDELQKHVETLAQFREDLDRIDVKHQHDQAVRQVEIDERGAQKDAARKKVAAEIDATVLTTKQHRATEYEAGLQAHRRGGRTGSYIPNGVTKANLDRIDKYLETMISSKEAALDQFDLEYAAGTAGLKNQLLKAEAEKDQTVQNLGISITRYTEAIVDRTERLAKAREKAG